MICYWDRNKQQYRYNNCINKIYYLTIKYLENELLQLTLKIEGKNGGAYKLEKCCGKTNKTSMLGGSLNMSLFIQIFLHTMNKM